MVYIRRLIWDAWNIAHIARHHVVPDEVEDVCQGTAVARQTYAGRILLIGPTRTRRMLAVVLDPEEQDEYYPVTARPASRRERRLYREEQEGTHQ